MSLKSSIPFIGSEQHELEDEHVANEEPDIVLEIEDDDVDAPDSYKIEWNPPSDGDVIDDISELHKGFIAPHNMKTGEQDVIKSGNDWLQVLYIQEWPQSGDEGFMNRLFTNASYDTDISIHIEPRQRQNALEQLESKEESIRAELEDIEKTGSESDVRDTKAKIQSVQQMYDLISQYGVSIFDVSFYIAHRHDSKDEVRSQSRDIISLLKEPPANVSDVQVATRRQVKGMKSTAPMAKDALGKKNAMMGRAAASLFPFTSSTIVEEGGVDFGTQQYNGSPVIVDRFARGTGYNFITIGTIGSGKSFSTKLNLLRLLLRRGDTDLIMLDPLEGFVGLNEALDGNRITVTGNVNLNPMEISETPQKVLEKNEDVDPYGNKLKDVISFFESYFNMRSNPLDDERRGVLERAIKKAYRDNGITEDPETHGNPSPTISDVVNIISEMARIDQDEELKQEYTISGTDIEAEKLYRGAGSLLVSMTSFTEGGEFENLTKPTDDKIRITDSRVTYIDLQQQETRGGTGLMMQLLFSSVYERAKEQTDRKTVFAMDEARYLIKEDANLEFLEQAVRHSRHYDLSIQFITQTLQEFFQRPEAEAIVDNCSMVQLNQMNVPKDIGSESLGLNEKQMNWVRDAKEGDKDRGYSEALLGVKEYGWVPIRIFANEDETKVIDFDPNEDDIENLPGREELRRQDRLSAIEAALGLSEKERDATQAGEKGSLGLGELGDDDEEYTPVEGSAGGQDDTEQAQQRQQTSDRPVEVPPTVQKMFDEDVDPSQLSQSDLMRALEYIGQQNQELRQQQTQTPPEQETTQNEDSSDTEEDEDVTSTDGSDDETDGTDSRFDFDDEDGDDEESDDE